MEAHKRILGVLYIVSGALQVITMLTLTALLSAILPMIFEHGEMEPAWVFSWIIPFFGTIAFCVILFIAVPSIVGGLGLLNQKKWALTLILILGCFKLFSIPIGTLLGIYTIWVYSEEHRKKPAAQ